MLDRLLSGIAPHSCCSCGYLGSILCESCKNDIESEPFSDCLICLKPTSSDNLCTLCKNATGFAGAWCLSTRDKQLKALLGRYKFDSAVQAANVCVELLDRYLPLLPSSLTVVPVPTAPSHQRVRGFDHTALIAKRFARLRRLPYQNALAKSASHTQHFKSRAERLRTAADSLSVSKNAPESVLLFDDIYTTGATVQACSRKLYSAGTQQVFLAILARQTLDDPYDL